MCSITRNSKSEGYSQYYMRIIRTKNYRNHMAINILHVFIRKNKKIKTVHLIVFNIKDILQQALATGKNWLLYGIFYYG